MKHGVFLPESTLSADPLMLCSYSPHVQLHASTSVRMLKVQSTGNHTIAWTHEKTANAGSTLKDGCGTHMARELKTVTYMQFVFPLPTHEKRWGTTSMKRGNKKKLFPSLSLISFSLPLPIHFSPLPSLPFPYYSALPTTAPPTPKPQITNTLHTLNFILKQNVRTYDSTSMHSKLSQSTAPLLTIIFIIIINPLTTRVVGAHRGFCNQFSPFFPVLHCPLGLAEL